MSLNRRDLDDAKAFQEQFVVPLVEAVRAEVRPVVEQAKLHAARLAALESNQRKALTGWSAFVAVASAISTLLVGNAKAWILRKVRGQ